MLHLITYSVKREWIGVGKYGVKSSRGQLRSAGAVVQWQDRQNVGNLWGQNQQIPHIMSTINP